MMKNNELTGHWKKSVSDPRFLSDADLVGQPEIIATISYTSMEEVRNNMEVSQKVALHFEEKGVKPMVLNKTNSKTVTKLAKSPMMEQWKGTLVQIYFDPSVRFGRETVGGVRIRPFAPNVPKCSDCKNGLKAHGEMHINKLAEYTKSKYGRVLCAECATKAAKGATT